MANFIKKIIPYAAKTTDIMDALAEAGETDSLKASILVKRPTMAEDVDSIREAFVEAGLTLGDNEPSPYNLSSTGVSPNMEEGSYNLTSDGQTFVIKFENRERILPKDVVNRLTSERLRKIKEDTGEQVNRIVAKETKDQVINELMPKALIKVRVAYATFFNKDGITYMMIMNASGQFEDKVYSLIRDRILGPVINCFKHVSNTTEVPLHMFLRRIAFNAVEGADTEEEKELAYYIEPYVSFKAKHPEDGQVSIKSYTDDGVNTLVKEYLTQGYEMASMQVRSSLTGDDMWLQIDSKGVFSRFACDTSKMDEEYGEAESVQAKFFAEAFIYSQEVVAMLSMIHKICGVSGND